MYVTVYVCAYARTCVCAAYVLRMYVMYCVCTAVCLPACLLACLPGWLTGCLPACLSVCLSGCLSVCVSVCVLFYLSMAPPSGSLAGQIVGKSESRSASYKRPNKEKRVCVCVLVDLLYGQHENDTVTGKKKKGANKTDPGPNRLQAASILHTESIKRSRAGVPALHGWGRGCHKNGREKFEKSIKI